MLKVTKFGGSSLCDSAGFARVREIVLADPARRVVVVSAAGKRHAADHKITDLLYLCHAHLQYEVSCWDLWRRVADRYREIRDGCALTLPIEAELEAIYAAMDRRTPRDWIVSRGEYLSARLMAAPRWMRTMLSTPRFSMTPLPSTKFWTLNEMISRPMAARSGSAFSFTRLANF